MSRKRSGEQAVGSIGHGKQLTVYSVRRAEVREDRSQKRDEVTKKSLDERGGLADKLHLKSTAAH